jgi:hypothetical protein
MDALATVRKRNTTDAARMSRENARVLWVLKECKSIRVSNLENTRTGTRVLAIRNLRFIHGMRTWRRLCVDATSISSG